MNYYNDNDPKACAWLRELIADGHLPAGDVDERSILEIKADELRRYDQCHFFAGVGFWSLALQWAGLGNTPGIWTGSCPCQPFSCAGAGKGTADERHLWPVFRDLIIACRPRVVFGEQVASAAVIGKVGRGVKAPAVPVWLDGVRADVEAAGYSFGAAVMGAHSVGAPHIRQRLYWVADGSTNSELRGRERIEKQRCDSVLETMDETRKPFIATSALTTGACRPSDAEHSERGGEQSAGGPGRGRRGPGGSGESGGLPDMSREWEYGRSRAVEGSKRQERHESGCGGGYGGPSLAACGGQRADGGAPGQPGHPEQLQQAGRASHMRGAGCAEQQRGRHEPEGQSATASARPWSDYLVHRYLDGKDRRIPTEPRLFPLADDRHPYHRGRVGLLRGAGNAIVPALAKEFIEAWMEVTA